MSADNWSVCPKCYPDYEGELGWEDATVDATVREDYEFYLSGSSKTRILNVDYSSYCVNKKCDFKFNLRDRHKLSPDEK